MHTSIQLIELAKERLSLAHKLPLPMTDYRLAKLMGLSTQVVSAWQGGKSTIGAQFAQKFAEVCELPEAYVYACIEHERERNPSVLRILETIAKKFHRAASNSRAAALATLAILAGLLSAFGVKHSENAAFASNEVLRNNVESVYSVKSRNRRRRGTGNLLTRKWVPKFRDFVRIRARWSAIDFVAQEQGLKLCAQ